jgi:hypothetical protein
MPVFMVKIDKAGYSSVLNKISIEQYPAKLNDLCQAGIFLKWRKKMS